MNVPEFSLPASDGNTYSHTDWKNQKVVLYLYPKDATPGCTLEANEFEALKTDFENSGYQVFGLSKDSIKKHENFCAKQSLTFPLLSDEEGSLIEALGSWVEKSMYGKTYFGIDRSTFVIENGKIVQKWRKVKAKGHAAAVLEFCQSYSRSPFLEKGGKNLCGVEAKA